MGDFIPWAEGDPLNPFRDEGKGGASAPRVRKGRARSFHPGVPDTLRALYQRYCDNEARELLVLLPREGLRALWGRARERASAPEEGGDGSNPGELPLDAFELLRAEARDILPLPPYDVWLKAYVTGRAAFLERMGIATAPERRGPVTVAVRPVNAIWWAHLNMEGCDRGWVGHIAFHTGADAILCDAADPEGTAGTLRGGGGRTTDIFRGESPDEIRDRFRGFTTQTLEAFLRSVTPGSTR